MMTGLNKSTEFYEGIEIMMRGGATPLDSIVEWCDRRGLEIESVAPLIMKNPVLLSKLRDDAENLNFLPRVSRLPV